MSLFDIIKKLFLMFLLLVFVGCVTVMVVGSFVSSEEIIMGVTDIAVSITEGAIILYYVSKIKDLKVKKWLFFFVVLLFVVKVASEIYSLITI